MNYLILVEETSLNVSIIAYFHAGTRISKPENAGI
jgi:hypothetical protein